MNEKEIAAVQKLKDSLDVVAQNMNEAEALGVQLNFQFGKAKEKDPVTLQSFKAHLDLTPKN